MLVVIILAWFAVWVMIKQDERRRARQGYWVEYLSPGQLRADEDGFAVVYHEADRWHFFYGKVGSPQNLNRLLVPDAAQWQAQLPDWLHGRREVVLERIGRDAKWVEIVTETEQA